MGLVHFIKPLKKEEGILTICGFLLVVFQSGEKGRGLIRDLLAHDITVCAFFSVCPVLVPYMDTVLVAGETAAEEAAVTEAF